MRYYVRVCRPRFEVALVEVDGDSECHALSRALEIGHNLPDSEWTLQRYCADLYGIHAEQCLSEEDLEADDPDGNLEQRRLEARSLEPDDYTRYLLLHADLFDGEGALVMQPWFPEKYPLMQIDIAGDWLDALTPISEKGWRVRDPDGINSAPRILPFFWPPWLPLIEQG